jgi:superoxide reductase
VVTDQGVIAKCLEPGSEPHADFVLDGAKLLAVYEYCIVHGLWKCDL